FWIDHVNPPSTAKPRQFLFDVVHLQPRRVARLELYEYINVAVGAKILTQHRTKEREFTNVMAAAEIRNLLLRGGHVVVQHVRISTPKPVAFPCFERQLPFDNIQIAADFSDQRVRNLWVPRHGRTATTHPVTSLRMATAFANQLTAVALKVADK